LWANAARIEENGREGSPGLGLEPKGGVFPGVAGGKRGVKVLVYCGKSVKDKAANVKAHRTKNRRQGCHKLETKGRKPAEGKQRERVCGAGGS